MKRRMFVFMLCGLLGAVSAALATDVELYWDDGLPDGSTMRLPGANENVVKFIPPAYPCTLKTLRFYVYPEGDTTKSFLSIVLHQDTLGNPGAAWDSATVFPSQSGWLDVDYSLKNVVITAADSAFLAGIHWTGAGGNLSPYIGVDNTSPDNMSWQGNDLSSWLQLTNDVMIRAVVALPIPVDTTPPVIQMVQQPPNPSYYNGDPYTVRAWVTDALSRVDSVVLFYQAFNDTIPQPWGFVNMSLVGADTYSAAIPETLPPAPLYQARYYVWAKDTSLNDTVTVTSSYSIVIEPPESLSASVFAPGYAELSWNPPVHCLGWIGFRIYRSYSYPGEYVLVDSVPADSFFYRDPDSIPGSDYLSYLTAMYPIGESGSSDTAGWIDAISAQNGDAPRQNPLAPSLSQNVPNPVSSTTVIEFTTPGYAQGSRSSASIVLSIYNMLGEHVRDLHNGVVSQGRHRVAWDGRDEQGRRVPEGLYFYQVTVGRPGEAGYFIARKRMLVVK